MVSQRPKKPRVRSLASAIGISSALFACVVLTGSAAAESTSMLDLCIRLAGPEKGELRFVADERCKRSERLVRGTEGRGLGSVVGDEGEESGIRLITGVSGLQPSRADITYMGPLLPRQSSRAEAEMQQPLPIGGVVSNLLVKIANAPGAGSWTYTVHRNGDGQSGALRCTISGSEGPDGRSCSSHGTIQFAPGDLLSLEVDPGEGGERPRKSGPIRWGVTLQPS